MKILLTITSLSSEGAGIGCHDGLKIFVDGALPGEIVEAEITEKKKNYAIAKLLSIQKKASLRTTPPCPLFGACGGCSIMHVKYEEQLSLKKKKVEEALKRIGQFDSLDVLPCLPSPSSLHYRNKIQLPIVWNNGMKTIGLYRKESHEIIPIERCLIQCPQGEEIIRLAQEKLFSSSVRYLLIKNAIYTNEALLILVSDGKNTKELKQFAEDIILTYPIVKGVVENINTRKDNVIMGKEFRTLAGRPFIFEKILKKTFKISPAAFFQVNPEQAEKLYEKAITLANIQKEDVVLDAFCGVGTLSLFASDFAKEVIGIECVSSAISDARVNAELNNIKNCTFICGKAEDLIKNCPADIVFLNPPRKGCEKKLIEALLQLKPKKILYVSCDPATLARDLFLLSSVYEPTVVQPFDMFPQTMHVETLVLLHQKSKFDLMNVSRFFSHSGLNPINDKTLS